MTAQQLSRRGAARLRQYPPLASGIVAMLIAAFILPSALSLPQTNPTQTLEYAPVPPAGDDAPPAAGNLHTLGLGSSSGQFVDSLGGTDLGPLPPPPGTGAVPRQKRCVGSPPRQTDDGLAPPCVAYFAGNNFGATYRGVTTEEVRILFYFEGGGGDSNTSRNYEPRPSDTMIDLWKPEAADEHIFARSLRRFQRYFNDRYQTYNRAVHFFVYYSLDRSQNGTGAGSTPETRRSDAAANYKALKPFAVLSYAGSYQDDYLDVMAKNGVLNFGSLQNKPAAFFTKYPALVWSYLPSLEEQAHTYADYVCTQIVPYPVSFGRAEDQGKPRKLGLIYSVDRRYPDYPNYAKLAKKLITECGGDFVAEGTFTIAKSCSGTGYTRGNNTGESQSNIANFASTGVTTIIWPTGMEGTHSSAAARAQYTPEWVLAGDSYADNFWSGQCQDQTAWHRHAIAITPAILLGPLVQTGCYRAIMEADPSFGDDTGWVCSFRTFYEDLRQLFTGIQVAGPRLNVQTVDDGFHAIPAVESTDPHVPACFYRTRDYTCVKDLAATWWDKDTQDVNGVSPGCWRMADGGRRSFVGRWPRRDAPTSWKSTDPCSGYAGAGLWP